MKTTCRAGSEDDAMRQRLRESFFEEPDLSGFAPVVVLWCFPHLEPINRSWAILSSRSDNSGLLRRASWDRHFGWEVGDIAPMELSDCELTGNELVEAFELFSKIEILGEQKVGIYDGPWYGRVLYDEASGEIAEQDGWAFGDTFAALGEKMSEGLRSKMQWVNVHGENDRFWA